MSAHLGRTGTGRARTLAAVGAALGLTLPAAACEAGGGEEAAGAVLRGDFEAGAAGPPIADVRPAADEAWPSPQDSIPGTPWTWQDWRIFQATLQAADARGFDTLPLGDAVVEMGALFLGTPYVPQTLEVPGPERMVVNFRGLDCVTFVENVLALTRFHRLHGVEVLNDPTEARRRYEADLATLRYRDGRANGYASRLHYFSEWLSHAQEGGRLQMRTVLLGGVPDPEPTNFMTRHRDAYRQLADAKAFAAIQQVEERLTSAGPRVFIPEEAIAGAAEEIRNGDVIAATSTVNGLDVAHTGLAWWIDGTLHLLHAPLVGSTVVLSDRPLADRILEITSQDGIMVARPAGAWYGPGAP